MSKTSRVAIVDGRRTPFVKAGTKLSSHSMQELGQHVLTGLVEKSGIAPKLIDSCIFSTVLLDPRTPNWAREMVFAAGLPKNLYAWSASNNCISGLVAATCGAEEISRGVHQVVIAGGSESMSNPALLYKKDGASMFLKLAKARSFSEKLSLLSAIRPGFLLPEMPSVSEPSTGLTMGQHMEITAKELSIAREDQDQVALKSHQNAAKAHEDGVFDDEIL